VKTSGFFDVEAFKFLRCCGLGGRRCFYGHDSLW
jgi:hypothetical protein